MYFSRLVNLKNPIKTIILLAAIFVLPVSIFWAEGAQALTIDSPRDCDANAVLNCGAMTPAEVKEKYNANTHARSVYHYFGITHIDVDNLHSQAVEGKVTRNGRVLVDGKEVATNATTAGYADMGDSKEANANGTKFFVRSPSESFQQDSLPAFVMMKDGQFNFAIIASCGNPVIATPVKTKPKPSPAPAAKTVPSQPLQQQHQQQTVVITKSVPVVTPVAVPTPVPTPVPAPVPQPQPKQLPNTGVGDIVGFGSFVTLLSSVAHFVYKRKFFA